MNTKSDVANVSMESEKHSRRIRRRRRNTLLYCSIVVLMAGVLLVSLCMTVLFNIKEINLNGEVEYVSANGEHREYNKEEIAEAMGIQVGDNMVRLNVKEAEQAALDHLVYLESITITREFPDTLNVDIQSCTPAYNLKYEEGTLVLSEQGRVLENSMNPMDNLINIYGYHPKDPVPGRTVEPDEENLQDGKILTAFMDLIANHPMEVPIVSIDMSNRNSILINFGNRIEFDMGDSSEITYKIDFAQQIISQQPADKEGYLVMIGNNQCSFRNKADADATRAAAAGVGVEEAATEPATDEEGNLIEPTAAVSSENPDNTGNDNEDAEDNWYADDNNEWDDWGDAGNDWDDGGYEDAYGYGE